MMVYDGNPDKIVSILENIVPYKGKIYYAGVAPATSGPTLWSYDGISAGPTIYPYKINVTPWVSSELTIYNGKLYFGGGQGTTGKEPTSFDGTNFSLIYDIMPGIGLSSSPSWFTPLQSANLLFFAADSGSVSEQHRELYRYDAITPPKRITINDGSNPAGSVPQYLQSLGNFLYFTAIPSTPPESKLFRVDVAGVVTIAKGATALTYPGEKLLVGNKIYFGATEPGTGSELYSYDGDTAIRLTDIAPGPLDGIPQENAVKGAFYLRNIPALYKGLIYFCGSADGTNNQLYAYNPSDGKTKLVQTINPAGDAKVGNLYVYRNALYFTAYTPATGTELWRYNDTTCSLYADIWPGPRTGMAFHYGTSTPELPSYAAFTEFQGDLYFKAQDSLHGYELWRIKGPVTPNGVENIALSGTVSMHPNPTSADVTMDLTLQESRTLALFLYDMAGREVYASPAKAYSAGKYQMVLPMQTLSAGQYIYRLSGAGGAALATGVLIRK